MEFVNRSSEMRRLLRVTHSEGAALVIVWGRRRVGKSRLLTEWSRRVAGVYWVADESAPAIQRRYLAEELESVLPGFSAVNYPDWNALLQRLSRDARSRQWRGPLIIDELPYLVAAAPELPSLLQKWVDREKREGGVVLALSGSSQRMMTDSVLATDAPLYGRADEMFRLDPLPAGYISRATEITGVQSSLDFYSCWGGVPRYWELAEPFGEALRDAVDELVLSPQGVLHDEVNRLLHLELPSAISLRPILDAVGLGAHRISEIAGRLQTPATSLSRGLRQLQELGYLAREVPYGENEKRSKKAFYRLGDPFLRLWFELIAPHRGTLQTAPKPVRLSLLDRVWSALRAAAWEELCRTAVPYLGLFDRVWHPAGRYWGGNRSEWDVVSTSLDQELLLLGKCKSLSRPATSEDIDTIIRSVTAKTVPPELGSPDTRHEFVIFVPEVERNAPSLPPGVTIVDAQQLLAALTHE